MASIAAWLTRAPATGIARTLRATSVRISTSRAATIDRRPSTATGRIVPGIRSADTAMVHRVVTGNTHPVPAMPNIGTVVVVGVVEVSTSTSRSKALEVKEEMKSPDYGRGFFYI